MPHCRWSKRCSRVAAGERVMNATAAALAPHVQEGVRTSYRAVQRGERAILETGGRELSFHGRWVREGPWERFGRYDRYVVVCDDGVVEVVPAHAGELVPGSTEDLVAVLRTYDPASGRPAAPMTLELDPTYRCASRDCGGRCFSAAYRRLAPTASISTEQLEAVIRDFAAAGGRVVRFDGGGDPLVHPAVRDGGLPELVGGLGMKSTILTSGDLLAATDLERIGRAGCYLRVSLNAATDATRRRFHGNRSSIEAIFSRLERFAAWLASERPTLPIGATYLLDIGNYREVHACALRAREAGVRHFSVRRVLGPADLRPAFSPDQVREAEALCAAVAALDSDRFRVFVPWRQVDEPDVDPSAGQLDVQRCWQSTFKTVVEPDPHGDGFRAQLCGRYRGSGVGQAQQMPPLVRSVAGTGWVEAWRASFTAYGWSREVLPRTCVSCIDRGFILMMDRLLRTVGAPPRGFEILHLQSLGARRLDAR